MRSDIGRKGVRQRSYLGTVHFNCLHLGGVMAVPGSNSGAHLPAGQLTQVPTRVAHHLNVESRSGPNAAHDFKIACLAGKYSHIY